ncbi:ABC transporter substrate-binding protein [Candidatus Poribacteria bacterium]|nr:ABC transporter substrate-binding protein [Candidatus Poribacteria bacterium]MYK24624.1 ABC transporter substrate-binding protein [Candidatus Poribacteria bacterium]
MHKFLALISLSVLLMIYVGCDNIQKVIVPQQEETLKIGFVVAGERVTYPNGAEMAVTEINQRGGLLGIPVELIGHINKEGGPEVSVQIAERLIVEDKIIALIGPNRSSHAVVVGPVAQRHGIPMITTTATNPNVTNAGNFVFMASFTDSFQGAVMAQFAKADLDLSTAAVIIRSGDLYTEGISEFFALNFSKLGGEIVANEFYEGDSSDFTAQLTNIAAAKPDALFTAGFVQDIAFITQQARAIPLQNANGEPTIFLGADSWDSELLFDDEDAEIEGSFFSGHFSPDTDEPNARAFVNTYESIYESTPTGGVAVSYDAVKLLFEAVERAGSIDPEKIREQLAVTENYIGATTIASYNENRHPTKSAVIFTIKDGEKRFHKQIDP